MKTTTVILSLMFASLISFPLKAQEKQEGHAKFKMEIIDENGNKHAIDTSFNIAPNQDYAEIVAKIKKKMGFSDEQIENMKAEMRERFGDFDFDMDFDGHHFTSDSLHKYRVEIQDNALLGKEKLEKAMEELKEELESLKMNEEALKKWNEAMEEFRDIDWENRFRQLGEQMRTMNSYFDQDENIFFLDGNKMKKNIWVDDDGDKHIEISMDLDSLSKKDSILVLKDNDNQNVWVSKDGDKIIVKSSSNGDKDKAFFGDEEDIEEIHGTDGGQHLIIKKRNGEPAKGDVVFITDEDQIKEFNDKDGKHKRIQYTIKSDDGKNKKVKMIVEVQKVKDGDSEEKMIKLNSLSENELAKAVQQGVVEAKSKDLDLENFSIQSEEDNVSLETYFKGSLKLKFELLDSNFKSLWKKDAGKVGGNWSVNLPKDKIKENGTYYLLFKSPRKAKLMRLELSH